MLDTGAERLEMECQILCNALRQSWHASDLLGTITAAKQLSLLFPDLLRTKKGDQTEEIMDIYKELGIDPQMGPTSFKIFMRAKVRNYLRTHKVTGRENRLAYYFVLDMGLILRSARLRLSHDLNVLRHTLEEHHLIHDDGGFVPTNPAYADIKPPPPAGPPPSGGMQPSTISAGDAPAKPQAPLEMPTIIRIMIDEGMLNHNEVRAIHTQMVTYAGITVQEVLLRSGYITPDQLTVLMAKEIAYKNNEG